MRTSPFISKTPSMLAMASFIAPPPKRSSPKARVRVAELIEWGAHFDSEAGQLLRTREGAHSLPRILHANGDATGAEISRSLVAFARAHKRIRFAEWTMVTGLVTSGGRVIAVDLAPAGAQRLRPATATESPPAPSSSPPAAPARSTPTPPIPP